MPTTICIPTEAEIRARAHQIYLEHGSQLGHDLDDWAQAEYELMRSPIHKITKLEPSQPKKGSRKSLVTLVRAAVLLGLSGSAASHGLLGGR